MKERKIVLQNGTTLNVKEEGEGEPFLILHGWGRGSDSWIEVQRILGKKKYRVIVPDLPGFGKSASPPVPWCIDDYAELTHNLLFSLNLKKSLLLGHSFGGRIAIKLAAKYPEKFKGLILVSAAGLESKNTIEKLSSSILAPNLKKISFLPGFKRLREFFYRFILKKTDYLKAEGTMKETFKKVVQENLADYLEKIRIKTLIIWGKNDKTLPTSDGYLMNEKISQSRLEIMENVGHVPQAEAPEKLAKIIIEFSQSQHKQ